MRIKLRKLFTNLNRECKLYENNVSTMSYIFKYYCRHLPYIPLPLIISGKNIIPVVIKSGIGYGRSTTYMQMLQRTIRIDKNYLSRVCTRGNTYYAIGPGCMYYMPHRDSDSLVPLFVSVVVNSKYDQQGIKELIHEHKNYIEVFLHNDIRSINSSVWTYIRKNYIPLLQKEGIRFSFKTPREITNLTTTSYSKPSFSSLKEMKEYNKKLSEDASLKSVYENTNIGEK